MHRIGLNENELKEKSPASASRHDCEEMNPGMKSMNIHSLASHAFVHLRRHPYEPHPRAGSRSRAHA